MLLSSGQIKKKTLENIIWCLGDRNKLIDTISIYYAQSNTPSQFRLSGQDEWYYAKHFLSAFQEYTDKTMRKNQFAFKWSLARLTPQQYFYMILRTFLLECYDKNRCPGNTPLYEEDGSESLTPIGMVFYKLLYIVTDAAASSEDIILVYVNPSQNLPTKSTRDYYRAEIEKELDSIKASIVKQKRITQWTMNKY